jgi:hypothetical protein
LWQRGVGGSESWYEVRKEYHKKAEVNKQDEKKVDIGGNENTFLQKSKLKRFAQRPPPIASARMRLECMARM